MGGELGGRTPGRAQALLCSAQGFFLAGPATVCGVTPGSAVCRVRAWPCAVVPLPVHDIRENGTGAIGGAVGLGIILEALEL